MDNNNVAVVGLGDAVAQMNTPIDQIAGEVVNLIFVGIDQSGSMTSYITDMEKCLKEFKTAITATKEVDDILLARADFESSICVGGYKKVQDFDINYQANGGTSLYDVVVEGKKKLIDYIEYLKNQGVRTKAVFAIFSDGEDTSSRMGINEAKNATGEMNSKEIVTAFISFGGMATGIAKTMDFKNILDVGSSASELRKAFNVLSKSVISSSKSVVAPATGTFFQMP